jgi:hypothetical protein
VPVTARLSKRFYDQFGDEVANELVDWFNAVDATYRSDLKELNELNFARFDASVGERFAQQDATLEKRFAEQDARLEKRFAEQDARLEKRFAEQDARLEKRLFAQDAKLDALEARMNEHFRETDGKIAQLRIDMAGWKSEMIRWMFLFWLGTVGATALFRG